MQDVNAFACRHAASVLPVSTELDIGDYRATVKTDRATACATPHRSALRFRMASEQCANRRQTSLSARNLCRTRTVRRCCDLFEKLKLCRSVCVSHRCRQDLTGLHNRAPLDHSATKYLTFVYNVGCKLQLYTCSDR